MGNPRNNSNSRANATRVASADDANQKHFVENTASMPVQDFLDEYVAPYKDEGARFIDFRYDSGESARREGKQKVSLLTVRMPQMRVNPDSKSVELNDKVSADGEVINAPLVDYKVYASTKANEALIAQKGTKNPFKGINVSPYYDTDPTTGKETGLAGFSLSISSGESVEASALGLRI